LSTVTLEEMEIALAKTVGSKGMSPEKVKELASYIMGFFGFDDSVVDNTLTSKDRDVFYMLEEEGLLGTMREEVNIKKSKLWRIHYWMLNKRRIKALACEEEAVEEDKTGDYDIYDQIPEDNWHHE